MCIAKAAIANLDMYEQCEYIFSFFMDIDTGKVKVRGGIPKSLEHKITGA